MGNEIPEPMDAFESWLLRRVAQAVEAGGVSGDLLTELQAEFEAARERPREDGEAAAVRQIPDLVGISEERAARVLASIEAEIATARQRVLRRIAEAWLEGQRASRGALHATDIAVSPFVSSGHDRRLSPTDIGGGT